LAIPFTIGELSFIMIIGAIVPLVTVLLFDAFPGTSQNLAFRVIILECFVGLGILLLIWGIRIARVSGRK